LKQNLLAELTATALPLIVVHNDVDDWSKYTETLCEVMLKKITKTWTVDKILTADIKIAHKKHSHLAIKFAETDKKWNFVN
jgi:hypothetical protein